MLKVCAVCGCKALWKAGVVKGKQRPTEGKSIQMKRETGFGSLSGRLLISKNCEGYE